MVQCGMQDNENQSELYDVRGTYNPKCPLEETFKGHS